MYHLTNDVGNAHTYTESEAVRNELLANGYKEVLEPTEKKPAPKKKK